MSLVTIVCILVFVILTSLTIYLVHHQIFKEPFVSHPAIRFMSRDDVHQFIREDSDSYIRSLTYYDLVARKSDSHQSYLEKAINAAMNINEEEKSILQKSIDYANQFIRVTLPQANVPGILCETLYQLPWILARNGRDYENGYPHTREQIIFLGTITITPSHVHTVAQTLIHEKMHVYQRFFPEHIKHYLAKLNCNKYMLRQELPLVRSNPDLDKWVYICDPAQDGHRKPMIIEYKNERPASIGDVSPDSSSHREHPYEHMAYYVANLYRV